MAKAKKPEEWTVDEAIEKLDRFIGRAWFTALQALECQNAWKVLNDSSRLTDAVNSSPCAPAASLIQDVLLQHQIIAVIRLFDKHSTDRLSFLTAQKALSTPGVIEYLEQRALNRPTKAGRNLDTLHKSIKNFICNIESLHGDEPTCISRLRNYRDSNIAHDLYFVEKPPPAYYGDIDFLLLEAIKLVNDLGLAVRSTAYDWEMRSLRVSVRALWEAAGEARAHHDDDMINLFPESGSASTHK
ncbi:hypothetical protein [Roseomonas haemaphysalidis]|uniref:HEPN AbiU2-like domain-containing protein n=1 Tax=Roseomonas haemaphysalidis TaxID=2768162 RepID=A0ABS3KKX8_9PROT|nr:hypothetical protein [Roseomonas haemaphysalidis]MBO1078109.1 hypothetical protein [Roseomonas haemaphysalidis]